MVHNSTTTTERNSHSCNTTHATAYASQQPNHLPTPPSQPLESSNTSNVPRNNLKRSVKVPPYLFILLLFSTNTIQSLVFSLDASIICNKIVGLVPKQRRMCRAYPEAMATIGNGAELAMRECQEQFALRRWNCSLSTKEPLLLFMSRIASKESAFVSGIRAAGIAYSITKACSLGNLTSCACDRNPQRSRKAPVYKRKAPRVLLRRRQRTTKQDWQWGGCSANVNYGVNFCKKFLDARDKHLDTSKALMNLHNNKVGRMILKESMKTNCRCSGVSGSCSLKTCWYSLPHIKQVGERLMKTYNRARQVVPMRGQRSLSAVFLKLKRSASHRQKKPHWKELVYLSKSPNYCRRNTFLGVIGTRGRKCDRKGKKNESCRHVCCKRGYVSRVVTRRKRCDCTFHWCCYVTCRECMEVVEESRCR